MIKINIWDTSSSPFPPSIIFTSGSTWMGETGFHTAAEEKKKRSTSKLMIQLRTLILTNKAIHYYIIFYIQQSNQAFTWPLLDIMHYYKIQVYQKLFL